MEEDNRRLVNLFERKINLLLEKNEGYARFKGASLVAKIKEVLSKDPSREDIMDLGFLLHLYALQLRLTMYKSLTPFTMLNFKKDLQEIINALHVYSRHRHLEEKPSFELTESPEIKELIPPLLDVREQVMSSSDNPELYNVIVDMLDENIEEMEVGIPDDIIKEMQGIDLKKIYGELPALIEKGKPTTVRKLANDFPVFENDRLSLVAVFNEVLFLANEGKLCLRQMEGDVGLSLMNRPNLL
jgi:hypothetical protein